VLVGLVFVTFVWGMQRRARLEATGAQVIRMLFVPSVEQGTLVERGDELARFIRQDSGLVLRSEVPTSYAAVIQALGTEQADLAWMPAFAYVIAHARYGAEAKLQVVRSVERSAVLIARDFPNEPSGIEALAGLRVALPRSLQGRLRDALVRSLDRLAPDWHEVPVEDDRDAVRLLVEQPPQVEAAASSHVHSGPLDLVGDGRKELEYDRPGTLTTTRIIHTLEESSSERATVYYGCIYARTDSGVRRLEDLTGRSFAFSDETSASGHIFPRLLLTRRGVSLGRVYFAGGHPNVVQAVWDGKALGGAAFYSPPSEQQRRENMLVGDARYLILKRMPEIERRRAFLEQVRIIALTDPIPNDLCAARRGFPAETWRRFEYSLARYLDTEEGRETLFELLAGVAVNPTEDSTLDGFRAALEAAGMSADRLLAAEEEKLERRRRSGQGGGS
jgi:ABC-type phosphate/phosphonate transport system substrate-binding protein